MERISLKETLNKITSVIKSRRRLVIGVATFFIMFSSAVVICSCSTTCTLMPEEKPPVSPPAPPTVKEAAKVGPKIKMLTQVPDIRVRLNDAPLTFAKIATTGGYRVLGGEKPAAADSHAMPAATITRKDGAWFFNSMKIEGPKVTVEPTAGSIVKLGDVQYRGKMVFIPGDGPGEFSAVNVLDVETYLTGVIAVELYRDWPVECYKSLAVAARTFALYNKYTFGLSNEYDLGDNQSSQCYGGVAGETTKSLEAVRATRGQVLVWGPGGDDRIFLTQYSASCGGRVNPAAVLREVAAEGPHAGGQVCTDCSACAKYRWSAVRVSKAEIFNSLSKSYPQQAAALGGGVLTINPATFTEHGRTIWIDVVGMNHKTMRIRADDLRLALIYSGSSAGKKIYSMNCNIVDLGGGKIEFSDGKGFGHGVGLCQWGAKAKADAGWSYERILQFYYSGAKFFKAY